MELRRVEVRNIRSYERAVLDLGSGTTLLVGDVGSGKSSLLYAAEMALFGTAEVEATYLVRHGATEATVVVALGDESHQYEIERTFRRVRRKGREAFEPGKLTYREDGAVTAYSSTELRQQVIRLLGFRDNPNPRAHSDLWRWAVYVPQEQMREILAAEPEERIATVRRALGVERYHLAAENAKEVARDLRQTAGSRRAQATTLREFADDLPPAAAEAHRFGDQARAAEEHLRSAEVRLGEARARLDAAQRQAQSLAGERKRLDDLVADEARDRKRADESAARHDQLRRDQETARVEIASLAPLSEALGEREEAETRAQASWAEARAKVEGLSVAEASWAGAVALRATREAELTRGEADLARAGSELSEIRAAIATLDAEGDRNEPVPPEAATLASIDALLGRARETERAASTSATIARHVLEELRELVAAGVCPRCHQPVHAEEFSVHELEATTALAETERVLDRARASRIELEQRRQKFEGFERAHAAWEARRARRATLESALAQHQSALESIERRLTEATDGLLAATHQADALAVPAEDLAAARQHLKETEGAARRAQTDLEQTRRAVERRGSLSERLRLLENEAERLTAERRELAEHHALRERALVEVRARLASEAAILSEARRAAEEQATADRERRAAAEERGRLAGLAEGAEGRLRRAEAATIERDRLTHEAEVVDSKASWLATSFHDAVLTMERRVLERAQAEFQHTFRAYFGALMGDPDLVAVTDAAFSPAVEIRGVETPAEALSGGERTSLALAYRLALARVVRSLGHLRLNTLLLDEPTDGFSPEQVQSMGELLSTLRLPQVILVSHERELEGVADRVVTVEKRDGVSVLTDGAAPPGGGEVPGPAPST